MTLNLDDEGRIKSYLLGGLSHEEAQRLEVRLLRDDDFVEHLRLVEDELVEDYERGSLTPRERERFEAYFLSTPRRRRKLMFVRRMSKFAGEAAEPARAPAAFAWMTSRAAPRWGAAALAVLVALAGVGLWRALSGRSEVREGLGALSAAYQSRRPTEARITGLGYAPWSVTRDGSRPEVETRSRDRAARLLQDAAHDHPGPDAEHALGKLYLAEHKFDQAIAEFERALRADGSNARLHNDLGVALLEKGKEARSGGGDGKDFEAFGRSVVHLNKAIELDGSLPEAHFNRALVYHEMALRRQAEEGWREYLRRDADSPWADEARRNLKRLEDGGRLTLPDADDALRGFLDAARSKDDAAAWKVVGYSYTSAGNGVANRLLDSELGLAPPVESSGGDSPLKALAYLARLERDRDGDRYTSDLVGHYERATPKQRALLKEARSHARAGYESFTKSRWGEAVGAYEKARLAYERAGDDAGRVFVEYRLAHCYIFLPDMGKARAGFERLSAVSEASGYNWLHAHSLYGLAHLSIDDSEFSKAADYNRRALSAFERAGDSNGTLRCLVQLADINRILNRVGRSLEPLRRGLALVNEGPAEPMQRWGILVQVGFGLSSQGLNGAALLHQKEALLLALDIERPLLVSRSYGYVGSAYAALRMYAEALDSAARAFEIGRGMAEGTGGAEIMANASQQSGDILRQSGECGRAVEAYDRSVRLYEGLNVEYYSYAAHRGKLLCFMAAHDDAAAGEELRTVLSLFDRYRSKITADNQRNSFFDKQQDIYDLAIRYGFERMRDKVLAFRYSEESRARSLLELLRHDARVLEEDGAPDLSLSDDARPLTLAEIQTGLPEGAQVLQYAVLEDRLLIWVVTKTDIEVAESGVGAQELTEKVRAYLAAARVPPTAADDSGLAARAADLYGLLVAPAERFLDKGKFLCVVPDKVLHYFPFGALVSPATGRYLIEDYTVGLAPSSSVFVVKTASADEKSAAPEENLVSIGGPSFNRAAFPTLPALPSAAREAEAVAEFYRPGPRVLLRGDATEQSVTSELQKADVAHFAMHYTTDESSEMLSGFPLAPGRAAPDGDEGHDGFLHSYEIYKLKLPRTRLVVLSACQTGIEQQYDGEGAVGVARPFLVAGVPSVVASLWPVDTDASAELMVNFHRHRRRDSLPTAEALRRAQIEMARGGDANYRHPFYWAPFVVIGGRAKF
jgi:CHAT domain-containing protein/tetratricopeptide (TPR) repeat protein